MENTYDTVLRPKRRENTPARATCVTGSDYLIMYSLVYLST